MKVLVECYHDTALVRSLGVTRQQIGHEHGKGNVLRQLSRWDGVAVGIVDADPGKQDSNPGEMTKYRERQGAHDLRLMEHHDDQRKRLVVIDPTLEDWLLSRAGVCRLRLREYGLPESAHAMHKPPRLDHKPGFHRFLADLAAADDGMKTLKKWLGM
ncbi:MAG: hypothetical protein Q8O57_00960 [Kiritimatiellota bacterium]|nr:hypothetical protein [Kiritimatiellota bacterium]